MNIPEYISKQEVRQVCQELNLQDWGQLTEPKITLQEAEIIQKEIGGEAQHISLHEFKKGLEVELEHGTQFPDANVTNNHPLLTGMIVLAHLKETLDYYSRLEIAELEGDMLKALRAGNQQILFLKYEDLLKARAALAKAEITESL